MHVHAVSRFRFDTGIEPKLACALDDDEVRHQHWLRERIGHDPFGAVVLTARPDGYLRPDGLAVVPAALLGP